MSQIDDGYAKYLAMQAELSDEERENDPSLPRTGRFELHVPERSSKVEDSLRNIASSFFIERRESMDSEGELHWTTVYTWDAIDPAYDGPAASSLRLEAAQEFQANVYLVWFAITGMAAVWEG